MPKAWHKQGCYFVPFGRIQGTDNSGTRNELVKYSLYSETVSLSPAFILICTEPSAFISGVNVFLFIFQLYALAFEMRKENSAGTDALNSVCSI